MVEKTGLEKSDFINSVIYFGAVAWCQPCKFLHPLMEEFSKKYPSLNFIYVDADKAPDVVREYRVNSVPTVKLFINNEEKKSWIGLQGKNVFDAAFSEYSGEAA
jgi:thioredoxin 1